MTKAGGRWVKNRRGSGSCRTGTRPASAVWRQWSMENEHAHLRFHTPHSSAGARPTTPAISEASTWHNIGFWQCHLPPNESCQAVTMCRSAQIYSCDRQLRHNGTRIVTEPSGIPIWMIILLLRKLKTIWPKTDLSDQKVLTKGKTKLDALMYQMVHDHDPEFQESKTVNEWWSYNDTDAKSYYIT